MFGLFKPRLAPVGPHDISVQTDIEASAAQVYALLDFADPRNAQRARGAAIVPSEGCERQFRMVVPQLPDCCFNIDVTDAESPNHYAYSIIAEPQLGRLAASTEAFTIWDLPGGGCSVRLDAKARLQEGVPEKYLGNEIMKLTLACHNSVAKLKLQAEQGVEAVEAVQGRLVV